MTNAEAIELIGSIVQAGGVWADFGAGTGTFTRALAELLGPAGRVLAIDRDRAALRELRRIAQNSRAARIEVVAGNVTALDTIAELHGVRLNGAVLANVLHFVEQPEQVLAQVRALLEPDGAAVVIEYDRRQASRWVPYPISSSALAGVAQAAGFGPPTEIARTQSQYQGWIYSAVMLR